MLFLKELKKVVYSISFIILLAGMVLMPYSQDAMNFSDRKLELPQPGQNYGTQTKEVPEIIMPAALESLYNEFTSNNYIAYPIGFYKAVKLSDEKQLEITEILSNLTDIPAESLMKAANVHDTGADGLVIGGDNLVAHPSVSLKKGITYDIFKDYMKRADDLIGGGSAYAQNSLVGFGVVPVTYEEAMEQYNLTKDTDRFTGGYARLFCDYMLAGVLSVLPVFLAVALCLKDRRSKMEGLIYTRTSDSAKIIFTRYTAVLASVMIPAVILAYISNASVWGLYEGEKLDYFAPLKYCFGWLLPSVMIDVAIGMFFTELTNTPIAAAICGIWWFLDINTGIRESDGYSLFRLAPRHNSLERTQDLINNFSSLGTNRVFFVVLSILLVGLTVVIYEQKRRGNLSGQSKTKAFLTSLTNRENQSEA